MPLHPTHIELSAAAHHHTEDWILSSAVSDDKYPIHPIHIADMMGDGVGQNMMGLLTVCIGTTSGRREERTFWWLGIAAAGLPPHLGHRNLCYGDYLEANDGHHWCPRMGSIYDRDDRPQRSPSGIHWTTLTVE